MKDRRHAGNAFREGPLAMSAAEKIIPYSQFEQLRDAREIIQHEAAVLMDVSRRLDTGFCDAADLILNVSGSVVVTGMGKAGLIGKKIAATFSSTGTRAHYLHPAEAVHGDLGCLHSSDVILALSNSGETEELTRILPSIRKMDVPLIAITATDRNTLANQAQVVITIGRLREAGLYALAPTASTAAMLAVGDALALVVSRRKQFTPHNFAEFHPGGSLGRKLKRVTEAMRPRSEIRTAHAGRSVRDVFTLRSGNGRRSGAVLLIDDDGRLEGLFTDSDLARLLECHRDDALDSPIRDVMTRHPVTIAASATLEDVVELLSQRKISEVPVVEDDGQVVGMVDITDVIGWVPAAGG
jgi:arabinose-5-phosphate isomerase